MNLYQLAQPLLFKTDSEYAHQLALKALKRGYPWAYLPRQSTHPTHTADGFATSQSRRLSGWFG